MAYGKIYTVDYDSFKSVPYTLEFWKKDYSGPVTAQVGGDRPVIHKWLTDDPKAPIKGSSIDMTLRNKDGALPLSSFYSDADDTFLVKHYRAGQLRFIGFMVQDDCNEILVDHNHYITLSANDNLGLLKDVPLNEVVVSSISYAVTISYLGTMAVDIVTGAPVIAAGDTAIFTNSPIDGTYDVLNYFPLGPLQVLQLSPNISPFVGTQPATLTITKTADLRGRMSLAEIIKLCLNPTNLGLHTNVYSQIVPAGENRWLEDAYLDISSFISGEIFQDCYKILESIMARFGASLCQAKGVWDIVRWDELRFGDIAGYEYDADMVYVQDITLTDTLTIGNGTDIETGITESILRGFKVVKETFNYRQPANILRNANFQDVGALIRSYADGTNTVYEYVMKDWDVGHEWSVGGTSYVASSARRFIRVTKNVVGEEIDRIGVIEGASGFDDYACAESFPIEITAGDRIRYSFDVKTNASQPGNVNNYFRLNIVTTVAFVPRSPNNKYLNGQGIWTQNQLLLLNTPAGSNTNEWQSVEVLSDEAPVSGNLYIKLAQNVVGASAGSETHYNNLRFEIFRSIAGSSTVIGQTHTDTQPRVINNRDQKDIDIDDSPSNAIAGTLFLASFTGPIQDRTRSWQIGAASETFRLGELTTIEQLLWRSIPRTKLDDKILYSDMTPLDRIKYTPQPLLNFIFGSLSIDYKNDSASGTLWEIFADGEVDIISNIYEFKYLYNNK